MLTADEISSLLFVSSAPAHYPRLSWEGINGEHRLA
jgi:hypothetical protein